MLTYTDSLLISFESIGHMWKYNFTLLFYSYTDVHSGLKKTELFSNSSN